MGRTRLGEPRLALTPGRSAHIVLLADGGHEQFTCPIACPAHVDYGAPAGARDLPAAEASRGRPA